MRSLNVEDIHTAQATTRRWVARALALGACLSLYACLLLTAPALAGARTGFIADWVAGQVLRFDTEGNTSSGPPIDVGPGPRRVAIHPNGKRAYIPNLPSDHLTVLDTGTGNVLGAVSLKPGTAPRDAALTPDGAQLYVTSSGRNKVSVIDTETNTVTDSIDVGLGTSRVAISPDGSRAYVSHFGRDNISVIDTETHEIVDTVRVGTRPRGIAVHPDGTLVYVANSGIDNISVIDAGTNTVVATIRVGTAPRNVAVTPDGRYLYVTTGGGVDVAIVDTESNSIVGTIPDLGAGLGVETIAHDVAIAPDGRFAYVTYETPNSSTRGNVAVIDTGTQVVVDTIAEGGTLPLAVAITPNQGPIASLKAVPASAGKPTILDATDSTDEDGAVVGYHFDFGDGTTTTSTEPVVAHAYQAPGEYTASVTVEDNEGGSTRFVTSGRTAYHNGTTAARHTLRLTIAAERSAADQPGPPATVGTPDLTPAGISCQRSLKSPYPSVSHWMSLGKGLRLRLRGEPGGYALRSSARAHFVLQVRKTAGRRSNELRKAVFSVDGRRRQTDRQAPYGLSVDTAGLDTGWHTVAATTYSSSAASIRDRKSKRIDSSRRNGSSKRNGAAKRTIHLKFLVASCNQGEAFSVGLSSKRPRTSPNLTMRVRTGNQPLKSVKFTLSPNLRIVRHVLFAGIGHGDKPTQKGTAIVGRLLLHDKSGNTVLSRMLRTGRRGMLRTGRRGIYVRFKLLKRGSTLTVGGIRRKDVTGLSLKLYGKATGLLGNPSSCRRNHEFTAHLETSGGGTSMLKRRLKMCKTPR